MSRPFDNEDETEYISADDPDGGPAWANLLVLIPVIILGLLAYIWFFCRIEPDSGEIAILTRKTGKDLPSGVIIAPGPEFKGIQLDVLPEGRYFKNPFTWEWTIHKITDIPAGTLGVLVRLYGKDLEPGNIIAGEEEKGILADILSPGKYRINPYAYHVARYEAITIRPGHVGIVTSLVGKDVLFGEPPQASNTFLVEEGDKGVQSSVLDPGTYYLNPFMFHVTEVTLQSQRFDFSGKDAISFLSFDGFTITVEGTIEWAIKRSDAAMLTVRVGDLEDVLNKIILPRARGFSRIEGSKKVAAEYITGITRQQFQDNLFKHLKDTCEQRGVRILSTLIRNIVPPQEIAGPIREKEIAVQDRRKYEQQILEAQSAAELAKQEQLAIQNREKVQQETVKIKAVIEVQQVQSVALTDTNRNLEVAKIENQAAEFKVAAKMAGGEAERDVIHLTNQARAKVVTTYVNAFGSGWNYASYAFLERAASRVQIIFGREDGYLGQLFGKFVTMQKDRIVSERSTSKGDS